jgi:hypothetical protein
LFARIGLKAETGPAEAFQKTMTGLKRDILGAVAGSLSLAGAIKAVNASMGDALELKKFSDATGASTDEMQRWRAVADQVSGSGAAVSESIKAIVSNQDKIKLGQGNISGYQMLGIDPRSDPFKVLEQIRAKTANLAPGMRRNIMGMFGVNTELISTLDLTNKQFDAMAKRAYVIPQSNIDGLNRARGSIEMVKNAIMYYTAEMATKLAPTIEKVSQGLVKFFGMIGNGVNMFDKLVRNTIGWKAAIIGIIAVLGIMNAGFLLSPIGLFSVAMLALLAIFDDFAHYSSGEGHSLIGVFAEKFPGLVKIIQPIADTFALILDALRGIITGDWSKFDELASKWDKLGKAIIAVKDALVFLAGLGQEGSAFMRNGLINGLSGKSFSQFGANVKSGGLGNAISKDLNTFWNGDMAGIRKIFGDKDAGQPVNMNTYITITGGDPKETEFAVKKALLGGYQIVQAQQLKGKKE